MPQRLLKTKYLFIADSRNQQFFIADEWNRLSMYRSAPDRSPKKALNHRGHRGAQRKHRIVSRSGRPRHSRSKHSWNSWIPRRTFRINKKGVGERVQESRISRNLIFPSPEPHPAFTAKLASTPERTLTTEDTEDAEVTLRASTLAANNARGQAHLDCQPHDRAASLRRTADPSPAERDQDFACGLLLSR